MNKIMFEMQAWAENFYFFASIDNDIVEYEIEIENPQVGSLSKVGKLEKEKSKIFIDFIEKADINNINELIKEKDIIDFYTDAPTFSISSFKYGNAFWNEYEELENMHYIYLAILLCDDSMTDTLLGEAEVNDNLSSNIKDIMNNLGLKLSQDDEE